MKLIKLKIKPRNDSGWGSKTLKFGTDITQLYGPNGCGKTPVIHSIAYAMGYPVKYREDILSNCKSVTLVASHKDVIITLKREINSTNFHIRCELSDEEEIRVFYNEKDISSFLFELLGISTTMLTSIKKEPTPPYISTFLPLFYVDQDSGYSNAYRAPTNFIKDQYSEMIRLSLGVPGKNSYERKRLLIEKKRELKLLDNKIVNSEKFIESLLNANRDFKYTIKEIDIKLEGYKNKFDELKSSQDSSIDSNSTITHLINEKTGFKNKLNLELHDIGDRISGFNQIREEIDTEIKTLSLNENARHLFTSFNEICSNKGCELFLSSSESYGKNLLYLKDQIKDLIRITDKHKERQSILEKQFAFLNDEIESLKKGLKKDKVNDSAQKLVNSISELTKAMIDLQKEREFLKRIEKEKDSYNSLISKREKMHDDIATMDSGGTKTDLRVLEFRTLFKTKIVEWLNVLSTKNVSREIVIDSDFNLLFGSEKISQFSGSTLLRVVLAIKAAFFDIHISGDNSFIDFLILDTPRQHDIESEHLAAFIQKMKSLVSNRKTQVIFSTTEYHYKNQENDIEWIPTFPGIEQNMFLGKIKSK